MKKEIKDSLKDFFRLLINKQYGRYNAAMREDTRDKRNNSQRWLRDLLIKLTVYYIFVIVTTITIFSFLPNLFVKQILDAKDPVISWVGSSIENEGIAYSLILASGNQNLVSALKHLYAKRNAKYELKKLDELQRKIKSENSCK